MEWLPCMSPMPLQGREAIRMFYTGLVAIGRRFAFEDQRRAVISGDLALTSTRLPDGCITAEIARRQADGTWWWAIDQPLRNTCNRSCPTTVFLSLCFEAWNQSPELELLM